MECCCKDSHWRDKDRSTREVTHLRSWMGNAGLSLPGSEALGCPGSTYTILFVSKSLSQLLPLTPLRSFPRETHWKLSQLKETKGLSTESWVVATFFLKYFYKEAWNFLKVIGKALLMHLDRCGATCRI